MTRNAEDIGSTTVDQVLNGQAQNQLILIYNQREFHFDLADYGLTPHSSQAQVISAISPAIREHSELGIDVSEDYAVISSESNLFLMPKPEQA